MKLQCTQENLNKALSNISRAVASRTTLPITQNVLLQANNGKLQLSATNLEMAINTWVGSEISEEGETTIPARIFTDLIKSYPNDNIDLNLNNNNLLIKCGSYNSNLFRLIDRYEFSEKIIEKFFIGKKGQDYFKENSFGDQTFSLDEKNYKILSECLNK